MNGQKTALVAISNITQLAEQYEKAINTIEEFVKLRDTQVKTISEQAGSIKNLKHSVEKLQESIDFAMRRSKKKKK